MKTKFTWNGDVNSIAKRKVGGKNAGLFLANTCAKYMDPYVPYDTGTLASSYVCKPFRVEYITPYAERVYFGDNLNFSRDQHILASSHWDIPMKNARKNDIAKDVTSFLRTRG